MDENKFQEVIQSCHLNFLIGAGCSMPYLSALGNIETHLTNIEQSSLNKNTKRVALASVLKAYFDQSIYKNIHLLDDDLEEDCLKVFGSYKSFFRALSNIVLERRTNLLNRQINLFTSNMDIFIERTLEELNIEFNDGFSGRINPMFSLSNFRKSIFKTSLHYDNVSELPLFNIYKIHGSLTWKLIDDRQIFFDNEFSILNRINEIEFSEQELVNLIKSDGITHKSPEEIIEEAELIPLIMRHANFLSRYNKLSIVNPSKEKFKHTTLNYTYYELIRLFANELEKENSVLFVLGFSFNDEHFREILLRALNSNPTLLVCVFAYDHISEALIKKNLKLDTHKPKFNNLIFMRRHKQGEGEDEYEHSLENISRFYFSSLSTRLSEKESSMV